MELTEAIEKIDSLKKEIDSFRPIDKETENRIMQKFRLDWNYHSNNIEGNSLTFGETKSFLLHGITAEGKPLKDHLDLKGHNEALLLLDDIVKNSRPLTETFIRELHEIILHEPYEKPAITPDGTLTTKMVQIGQYKKTPNHVKTVTGEIFYFSTPEETPAMMNDLMDWYANVSSDHSIHPAIIAAEFHYKFIRIHPFDDGNGRIARILMNIILMKNGYPPVIIKTQEKADYYRALQMADGGDISYFDSYIAVQLIYSLELYLKGAKGESIEDLDDVDKQIAMLKTELKAAPSKIIYSRSSSKVIAEESIIPLLKTIFFKLSQFNELFRIRYIEYQATRKTVKLAPEKNSQEDSIFKSLKNLFIQDHVQILISKVNIKYILRTFLRTEEKDFDCEVEFQINLNRFDFTVTLIDGDKPSVNVFYHNKVDDTKFNKIANLIAQKVLNDIKTKLAE